MLAYFFFSFLGCKKCFYLYLSELCMWFPSRWAVLDCFYVCFVN